MDVDPPSDERVAVAYHEAGHAVMALALGRAVMRVSVLPDETRLGHCEIKKGAVRKSHDVLETQILILFAGLAAEARHTGRYAWSGASQDLQQIRALSRMRAKGEPQVERLERRLLQKAEHELARPGVWAAIQNIAESLLSSTTISGRAARHLFEGAINRATDDA